MKTKLFLLLGLSIILLSSCSTEDSMSTLWGIDYSSENASSFAMGSVDQYKADTKTSYIVKTANLRCAGEDTFILSYTFENDAVLELKLDKKTISSDYPFPGTEGGNRLISATFNGVALNLVDSKLSVQPRTEENKFSTFTKLQTQDEVLFDGSIGRVPLLK